MEFLKKIWDAISGLFGGSDISLKSKKEVRKNVIKGEPTYKFRKRSRQIRRKADDG